MAKLLVVEDQETLRSAIAEVLGGIPHEVKTAESAKAARIALEQGSFDLVLTDLRLESPESGLEVLSLVRGKSPSTEVLLMTAYASVEVAVTAMREGAADFLVKPFSMEQLIEKVKRHLAIAADRRRLARAEEQIALLSDEVSARWGDGALVGRSSSMVELFRKIEKVAESSSSVLILGESGTGKELVARAIHQRSRRKDAAFVKVNCGALAPSLLESELFGHEKGSFTGAVRQRRGRFELADGGTLLLDEVAEIDPGLQVKLLRVLQERQFERVGGEESLHVDVRVIAATHRDLEAAVASGAFRQDLFYRLFVIPLRIPPLRERLDDVPALAAHFLDKLSKATGRAPTSLDPAALDLLCRYHWPGNVRELENVIERALVLCEGESISVRDLPFDGGRGGFQFELPPGHPPLRDVVEAVERQLIARALREAKGVKMEAARLLDLKPSVLYYKLEKYGFSDASGETE